MRGKNEFLWILILEKRIVTVSSCRLDIGR